jgi:hypothetical protein
MDLLLDLLVMILDFLVGLVGELFSPRRQS